MGYTHYWRAEVDNSVSNLKKYKEALDKAKEIVKDSKILAGWDGEGEPLLEAGIAFNGSKLKDEEHESFFLPEFGKALKSFQFCKTARKPYDTVVTAVLATMAHYAPNCISVSSDGAVEDWEAGVTLAREVLNDHEIENPMSEL